MKVNDLLEILLLELGRAIANLFYNPLFYWFFIFIFILGIQRIKSERKLFGIKIFGLFHEWKKTLLLSLFSGLIVSIISIGINIVFNYDIFIILLISIFLISLTFNPAYLSPIYTIGLTYFILLFLPLINDEMIYLTKLPVSNIFTHLTILLGILLIVESLLIKKLNDNRIPPHLKLSDRGIWIGFLNAKKTIMIPFVVLLPTEPLGLITKILPNINIGEMEFSLMIVPFILGFNYQIISEPFFKAKNKIAKQTFILAIIVLSFAIGSIYLPLLSFVGILLALLFKELMSISYKSKIKKEESYYRPLNKGIIILAILPSSPAERLNLNVGETIMKVNNQFVSDETEFYRALQSKSASFKLNVLNHEDEIKFITGSLYEFEDHNLGLVFPDKPYNS